MRVYPSGRESCDAAMNVVERMAEELMPHDDNRIGQRAGFIAAANQHRQRHQDAATAAKDAGKERAASYHEARAATYSDRISKTAQNIKKLTSGSDQ